MNLPLFYFDLVKRNENSQTLCLRYLQKLSITHRLQHILVHVVIPHPFPYLAVIKDPIALFRLQLPQKFIPLNYDLLVWA